MLAVLVLYMVIRCLTDYRDGHTGTIATPVFPVAGIIALLIASPIIAAHYMATPVRTCHVVSGIRSLVLSLFADLGHRLHWSPWVFLGALVGGLALAVAALLFVSPTLARMSSVQSTSRRPPEHVFHY